MGRWLRDPAMEVGGGNLEGDLSGGTKQMDLPTRHCGGTRFGELSGGPAGQTSWRADRVGVLERAVLRDLTKGSD